MYQVYYFTFGMAHEQAGQCQPIIADSPEAARARMVEIYGNKWAFQYTGEEYTKSRLAGCANETVLSPISC